MRTVGIFVVVIVLFTARSSLAQNQLGLIALQTQACPGAVTRPIAGATWCFDPTTGCYEWFNLSGQWQNFCAGGLGGGVANQPGSDSIINVKNYGAKGDNVHDDTTAIQTAVYAAGGWNGSVCGPTPFNTVFFPAGTYQITQPIHEPCGSLEIYAANITSGLQASGYYGPTWLIEGFGNNDFTFGPALIGSGRSISTNPVSPSNTLNLTELINRPSFTPAINGASGLDVEVGFQQTVAYSGDTIRIFSSDITAMAKPAGNDGRGFASIYVDAADNNHLKASVRTTTQLYLLTTTTVPSLNTAHDAAVDYDGANCRLFLDGTLLTTIACTGTVVQNELETEVLPSRNYVWPYGNPLGNSISGYVGPIRIEAASLHTSNYTPVTMTSDGNTAALCNFVPSPDGLQIVNYAGTSLAYLPVHGNGGQEPHVHLHTMSLSGWFLAIWSWQAEFDHLYVNSLNQFYGIGDLGQTDFETSVHDNNWVGPSALGVNYGAGFSEGSAYNNMGGYAWVGADCDGGCSITDTHFVSVSGSVMNYLYAVDGGHAELYFPFADMEGADTSYISAFYFGNNYAPSTVIGGEVSTYGGHPYVTINGGAAPTFIGMDFNNFAADQAASAIVDYINVPTNPAAVVLENNFYPNSVVLSTKPAYISTPSCGGSVTLSSGSGTLTQTCVGTGSNCTAVDVTNRANSVTLGNPTTNSIGITGTGSDVIKVSCQ